MTQTMRNETGACLVAFTPDGGRAAQTAWVFPRAFTGFQGHFPGHPVCPGVCVVLAQLAAAERLAGAGLELVEIESAKFTWPVFPERRVEGRLRAEPAGAPGEALWRVRAVLTRGERGVAKIQLLARAGDSAGGGAGAPGKEAP